MKFERACIVCGDVLISGRPEQEYPRCDNPRCDPEEVPEEDWYLNQPENRVNGLVIANGKYTFRLSDDGYSVDVLRYGEPWLNLKEGANAVLALVRELQDMRVQFLGQR